MCKGYNDTVPSLTVISIKYVRNLKQSKMHPEQMSENTKLNIFIEEALINKRKNIIYLRYLILCGSSEDMHYSEALFWFQTHNTTLRLSAHHLKRGNDPNCR